jgi:hypothetical protein
MKQYMYVIAVYIAAIHAAWHDVQCLHMRVRSRRRKKEPKSNP